MYKPITREGMAPIKEEDIDVPFHLVENHMEDHSNPRARGGNLDSPNNRHASAKNVYSISSTVTGTEVESPSRIADLIREEADSRVFLKLKLKPLITPFHVICYYVMIFTL